MNDLPVMGVQTQASSARQAIWQIIASVPRGKVATYGQVAKLAGLPGHARYVGYTLKRLPADSKLPWYRIINARGEISFVKGSAAYHRQRDRLEAEGVEFAGDRIPLRHFGWKP
ncbi:MAG: MGMT family protein [Pseudohongiellaceae bacterium]